MENKEIGKWLIITGIFIAIVPTIAMSAWAFYSISSFGALGKVAPPAFFIIGIIITAAGGFLRR
ncbi:MAG: hypothetical protein PHU95_02400 [Candidatus Thermoplasmatota archaeon]|nr:hypothetical protein [Candidatus Thermoplasmatota archaeon]MDD5778283.1 hypothetical protein [Candidatus Thermoplasmatota archaeon]